MAYSKFVKPDEMVRSLAHKAITRFCDTYLAEAPLDDEVIIRHPKNEDDYRTVKKDKVEVFLWRVSKDIPVSLKEAGNEFELSQAMVISYYANGSGYRGWRLEPTSKSRAARYYNEHRAKLKWTAPSLESLLARTQDKTHKPHLIKGRRPKSTPF